MFLIERTDVLGRWRTLSVDQRTRVYKLFLWIVLTTLLFLQPLLKLIQLSVQTDLHSHIPLVPFVSAYLLYIQPRSFADSRSSVRVALMFGVLVVGVVVAALINHDRLSATDYLGLMTLGYVSAVASGGFLYLGSTWMKRAAFPVAFLIFMVPLPDAAASWIEKMLVLSSAETVAWLFRASGTPVIREGTIFALPTIVLEVARECSGIRSTWVLFITSLVASHMFLTTFWRRVLLVAFIIPLGIVRNAFRILVIGLLCTYVGPHMVDSFIHTRGGPIFFVISLLPLFLLLSWLRRHESKE